MIITKKFEITITIDTEKANVNADKWGATYDWDGYPNWMFNYARDEHRFIENRISEFRSFFKFAGLRCAIKELK